MHIPSTMHAGDIHICHRYRAYSTLEMDGIETLATLSQYGKQ